MKIDLNKFYYHERFGLLTPVSGYIHCDWSKEFGTPQGQVVSYDDDETMTCSDYPIGSIVYIVPWRCTAKVIHHYTSNNNIIVEMLDCDPGGRYNFNVKYITKQNESRNRKDFTIGKKIYIPTANYHSKILESFGFLQTIKGLVLTVTKDNYAAIFAACVLPSNEKEMLINVIKDHTGAKEVIFYNDDQYLNKIKANVEHNHLNKLYL